MIIADTNVVSEFMKEDPDPAVLAWAATIGAGELTICVVTVQEITHGLGRLPQGRRRRDLEQRWDGLVGTFSDTIVVHDVEAALATAQILVRADATGHPMGLADAQIAGVCLSTNAVLATRNVRDFDGVAGLRAVNPFE